METDFLYSVIINLWETLIKQRENLRISIIRCFIRTGRQKRGSESVGVYYGKRKNKCLLSHITRLHTHNLPLALHLSLPLLPICFPEGSWHRCVIYVILFAVSGSCVSLSCCGSADTVTHDTHTWDRRADGGERQVQDQK